MHSLDNRLHARKYDVHHIAWLWCENFGDRSRHLLEVSRNEPVSYPLFAGSVAATSLALTVFAFAACSGDAESSNAEPDEAAASAAQKRVDAYLEPVEDIDVTYAAHQEA